MAGGCVNVCGCLSALCLRISPQAGGGGDGTQSTRNASLHSPCLGVDKGLGCMVNMNHGGCTYSNDR